MHLLPIAAALWALGASPQRAPTPDEVRLYDEGAHALAGGDARAAEKAWRAGYAIGHDPAFLVHIGEAEEKAGAPAEAAESYRQYLREAPDASDRPDIEQRLSRLAPATPAPSPAVETPGEFGGTPPAGAAGRPATTPVPAAAAGAARADDERPVREEEGSGWNRYNATAVIASGVTLILLGTAAIYGAEASSKESDVNRLINYRFPPTQYSAVAAEYTSAMADGARDAHNARVVLVAAAATGVVAVAGFVLDAILNPGVSETAPATGPAISLAPLPGGRGAFGAWSWRFWRSRRRGHRRAARLALLLAVALLPVALASCFNPAQPGCAFSCAGDGLCPSGYTCGGDLLCHRNDGQGICAIQTDAAPSDATQTDTAGQ